jgi:hypothetical protein
MVVQLDGDDPGVAIWRIADDIGEIGIEREKDTAEFLSFGDDVRIRRANGKMVAKDKTVCPSSRNVRTISYGTH